MTDLPTAPVNRQAELDRLIRELHRIEGPTTDYGPWYADVAEVNSRLQAAGQEVLRRDELARSQQWRRMGAQAS